MKKQLTFLVIFLSSAILFGQGAGNYYQNQKKAPKLDDFSFEEINQSNRNVDYSGNYQYQDLSRLNYPGSNDTVLYIETSSIMNVKADAYIAVFGLAQIGGTVENSHELINSRIKKFIESCKTMGIYEKDIYIDFISQAPIFAIEVEKKLFSKTYNEIPKGFEIKKNVHIYFKDKTIADQLIIEAAKNEIYDIIRVDYIVSDYQQIYDTLRNVSIKQLDKKIKDFSIVGVKILPLYQSISEKISSTNPLERYSSFEPFIATSLSALTNTPETFVSKNKNINLYYNKLSYKMFETVINPEIVEPVVQFTYWAKVKCVLKKQ
ncbi:MAG: SIMPL domain-containing protein [Bacteroidota bacterium]